jgi:hypothetical protein
MGVLVESHIVGHIVKQKLSRSALPRLDEYPTVGGSDYLTRRRDKEKSDSEDVPPEELEILASCR